MSALLEDPIQQDHEVEEPGGVMLWWPVFAAMVIIALVSVASFVARLTPPNPFDPWEPVIVAEGYRASVGLPVYTRPAQDHSTHIYGPLITYLLGMIFKWTGIGFTAPRLLSLAAALCIMTALAMIYFRRLPPVFAGAGVVMLLSLNLRTKAYFTQSRPDMLALGVALLALIFLYRGWERRQWIWYVVGVAILCTAYLFKQTTAMFAAVPLVSLIFHREGRSWSKWVLAIIPMAAIALVIGVIWMWAPIVHYYMHVVVQDYPIEDMRLVSNSARFLGFTTLLPIALCLMITMPASFTLKDPRMRWLAAACVVTVPASILAYSKNGGEVNSYLPALFPLTVLCIVVIAGGWKLITQKHDLSHWARYAFAWLFAGVMIAAAFGAPNDDVRLIFGTGLGDAHYPMVVQHVRGLKGRVVSPDDTTIPIVALGQAGRATWGEHDTQLLHSLPEYFAREIRSADWVVLIDSQAPMYQLPEHLRSWGFTPAGWNGTQMGAYTLWKNPGNTAGNR